MTEQSPLNITKAKQKRSQYSRHGRKEVLDFEDWYPIRIKEMRSEGWDIRSKEIDGVLMIGMQKGLDKPIIITEKQFFAELDDQYQEEYLAGFGLKCSLPFEENAGLEMGVKR